MCHRAQDDSVTKRQPIVVVVFHVQMQPRILAPLLDWKRWKAGFLVVSFSMIEITRGSVSMTSPCSISKLLKSFALFTPSLSRSQPCGLLCLRLAVLFSPAVGYALLPDVGYALSVLLTMSPDRRCTSRKILLPLLLLSLFTTGSLAVVPSLFLSRVILW